MAQEKDKKQRISRNKDVQQVKGKFTLTSRDSGSLFSYAYPATVEEIVARTGTRGDITQVRCKVMDGRDTGKILRRNVRGPIRIGDVLMLRETEIEARKLTQTRR
ncbi:MAG: 30S ribosomal protein S28e [Nanoarchaeota archaeon]|nr:30S ribosomal protein S28e [Nanoarchaeota archaeon]